MGQKVGYKAKGHVWVCLYTAAHPKSVAKPCVGNNFHTLWVCCFEYFWKIWVAGMGVFTSASSGLMFCTNFSDSLLMLKFVRWTKLFEMFSGSFEYGSVANLCASCYFWKYCWIVCFFHELGKLYRRLQLEISSVVTIKQDCLLFHWCW